MIEIGVDSNFSGYSRFNTIIMCGGFTASKQQLYVESARKAQGESLTRLEVPGAHQIEVIVYFVPLSTPKGKNAAVVDHAPFEATVRITSDEKEIYNHTHSINAWGGAAIKLNIEL